MYAANAAWMTVLGFANEEVEHTRFLDLVHADDRSRAESSIAISPS